MNSADVITFWTVLQCGTMTAAADALYITQPTLTARIQALENEVGAQLFRRGKGQRRIELTEAGKKFIPLALRWQNLMAETKEWGKAEQRGIFRIGAVYSTNQYILPPVYSRFLSRGLPTCLSIQTIHDTEAIQAVESNEMDLALLDTNPMYSDRLDIDLVFREEFVLLCAKSSGYPDLIDPRQLDVSHEILLPWQREFMQWHTYWFGTAYRPMLYVDSMQMVEVFSENAQAWVVAPVAAARYLADQGQWRICHFTQPPPQRDSYLVRRKGEQLSPAGELFLEDLQSVLGETEYLQQII